MDMTFLFKRLQDQAGDGTGSGSGVPPETLQGTPPGDGAPAPWFGVEHAELVKSKKWASPNDALRSYGELEKFVGAPADRLLKLPEKPDAPEWSEIRKRVGIAPPEKPEDYGIAVPEGYPPDYAQTIAAEAHKLGVPKEMLAGLAAANQKIVSALEAQQSETIRARESAAELALQQKYGAQYAQIKELQLRELDRLGIKPELVEAMAMAAALSDDQGALLFRTMLAEMAAMRREAPLHGGSTFGGQLSKEQAQATLAAKSKDDAWVEKATSRGTTEAEERLRLIALANGVTPNEDLIKKQASGQLV